MDNVLNIEAEMEERKAWIEDDSAEEMLIDDLIDYAIYGLARCELCKEDCFCIRARFPDPRYYKLYEVMMLKTLGNISQDLIPLGITKKGDS